MATGGALLLTLKMLSVQYDETLMVTRKTGGQAPPIPRRFGLIRESRAGNEVPYIGSNVLYGLAGLHMEHSVREMDTRTAELLSLHFPQGCPVKGPKKFMSFGRVGEPSGQEDHGLELPIGL